MDKPYRYNGPQSAVTLPGGREVLLHDGQTALLPEDNGYVATLLALGRLVEVTPAVQTKATAKAAKQEESDVR